MALSKHSNTDFGFHVYYWIRFWLLPSSQNESCFIIWDRFIMGNRFSLTAAASTLRSTTKNASSQRRCWSFVQPWRVGIGRYVLISFASHWIRRYAWCCLSHCCLHTTISSLYLMLNIFSLNQTKVISLQGCSRREYADVILLSRSLP